MELKELEPGFGVSCNSLHDKNSTFSGLLVQVDKEQLFISSSNVYEFKKYLLDYFDLKAPK